MELAAHLSYQLLPGAAALPRPVRQLHHDGLGRVFLPHKALRPEDQENTSSLPHSGVVFLFRRGQQELMLVLCGFPVCIIVTLDRLAFAGNEINTIAEVSASISRRLVALDHVVELHLLCASAFICGKYTC